MDADIEGRRRHESYLFGRGSAWFAYGMTVTLMIFDYIDRQVVVSIFPFLKAQWDLTDKELGSLVSVVSVTVALLGIPVAWVADRFSRVKSIVVMAVTWSLATIACMFSQNYLQLLIARSVVGAGEAGYGSVGAAILSTHFPQRMRGGVLGGFFASASVGSVLGVILGGIIASRWGWQAAFGVVGIPGLIIAIAYLFVRDYRTVKVAKAGADHAGTATRGDMIRSILRSRTVRWVCIGAAGELIALSALWSWLPSYLNRTYNLPPDQAGIKAALVVLCGALGSVVLGAIVDYFGRRRPGGKFMAIACLSLLTMVTLMLAFGSKRFGMDLDQQAQFRLILLGGFLATCTVGPAAAIVIDVIHPGVRSTGASVLSLFQNLLGLAAGPFIAGAISDALGLEMALTLTPLACMIATVSFLIARGSYRGEHKNARYEAVHDAGVMLTA
jgi:MFS transporter, Spinster family, sphingosine-1-phosphate transporter